MVPDESRTNHKYFSILPPINTLNEGGITRRISSHILFICTTFWPLWLTFTTIGSVAVYIFFTQVLAPTPNGWVTGGGGLYGDTALHSGYTMSIVTQGLPPKNPLFAPIPLVYPFLVNLFSKMDPRQWEQKVG